MITNLLKMLRRLIGEHIELDIQTQADLQPVFADLGQIEQVMINLCVNARDAMPGGGRITLATQNYWLSQAEARSYPWANEGHYVLLSVTDTGAGIPLEIQDRIFEPFFTTKEVGEGTGLGLATVYAIVSQHNGGINLVSELGQGTTFQIFLPAVAKPNHAYLQQQPEAGAVYGGTEVILLAEDDDSLRELASTILQKSGYTVLVARDGEEAIYLFQQHADKIDLVVLDVIMPKQSGRMVYDRIRVDRPELPVIFSTGYGFNVLKNIHLPDDGSELIRKPYSPRFLLTKVREVLDAASSCRTADRANAKL